MFYIFLSLLTYSGFVIAAAYANRNANISLVTVIVNLVSVSIPILVFLTARGEKISSKGGLAAAFLGGIFIAIFGLSLGKAYEQNNVAIVGPIVFGGSIVVTSIVSYFLFKEKIVPIQALGLLLVTLGLCLVVYSRIKA